LSIDFTEEMQHSYYCDIIYTQRCYRGAIYTVAREILYTASRRRVSGVEGGRWQTRRCINYTVWQWSDSEGGLVTVVQHSGVCQSTWPCDVGGTGQSPALPCRGHWLL